MKAMNKSTLYFVSLVLTGIGSISSAQAANLSLADKPLFTGDVVPPMMMLVMSRDHSLFYEAYNDATDLDGDDEIDLVFLPHYNYEGYFDSGKCYSYANDLFTPTNFASTCPGNLWSGNFLNYMTMTRMDLLRKVLYGGKRSTDNLNSTILERTYIPQDAHSWAKSYHSETYDGYKINDYTPYNQPVENKQHFFGSVTYTSESSKPILRVVQNAANHNSLEDWGVWYWASTERPVLEDNNNIDSWGGAEETNYTVRVEVCKSSTLLETNCKKYSGQDGTHYKPTGLLHDYGDSNKMLFGLLTGSYDKNLSGGVLRKAISNFSEEVNQETGVFTNVNGIVNTINKIKIYGFNYTESGKSHHSYDTHCGWITDRAITEGECASWGNPVGEMLYESLRYLAGEGSASTAYDTPNDGVDNSLGLPKGSWTDPFAGDDIPHCTRATNLLISDINPSYDSDQLPGVYESFADTNYTQEALTDFSVSTLLGTISEDEHKTSGKFFIGQSGDTATDNAPTAKTITGLASVRGLAPSEPTKMGSYSAAAVAYYGLITDINSKRETQNVKTMVVALASPLPEIKVDIDGKIIKIIPFAKSVNGNHDFKPTNTIVDWYTQSLTATSGAFFINFEDVEQGADHDMDMVVKYSYNVSTLCYQYNENHNGCAEYRKGVQITLNSTYAFGGNDQHAGYIISGSDNDHDGLYLEVEDHKEGGGARQRYKLDTPSATDYNARGTNNTGDYLPYNRTRKFFPGSSVGSFLPSPLEYAAKWGGFIDENNNNKPDLDTEWDANDDGIPDAYFPVTNAGKLKPQLDKAFKDAFEDDASTTAPIFSSNFMSIGTTTYLSSFTGSEWSGEVKAVEVDADGEFSTTLWSASKKLDDMPTIANRKIYTSDGVANFEFTVPSSLDVEENSYSAEQIAQLLGATGAGITNNDKKLDYLKNVVNFLRGDRTLEGTEVQGAAVAGTTFRTRASRLGDIINSTPYYVAAKEVLVFGANDGMVHIINAQNGNELMAYIPSAVYSQLNSLTLSPYHHQYLVDGGVSAYTGSDNQTTVVGTLGTGAKGVYAIDVTNMDSTSKDNIKWEITTATTGYTHLGYTNSKPMIVKLATKDNNGENEVGVVFSNGYNSSDANGTIYIAKLSDGSLIKKLTVGTQVDPSGLSRPNAIATPAVVDLNSDNIADRIYAGDLYGNMWAFDISDENKNNWGLATADNQPLFIAKSPTQDAEHHYIYQPITSRPSIGLHPTGTPEQNGVLVAFGTGKYIESGDNASTNQATQSFYVIWDKYQKDDNDKIHSTAVTSTRDVNDDNKYTDLLRQEIIDEDADNRELSAHAINWHQHKGFYIDLINTKAGYTGGNLGERQVTNSSISANKVIFTTLLPNNDPCGAGGTSWYMEINTYTGKTWYVGTPGYDDDNDNNDRIADNSSNKKLDAIATDSVTVFVPSKGGDSTNSSTNGSTEGGGEERTCMTLSNNKIICFTGKPPSLGSLSWKQLY